MALKESRDKIFSKYCIGFKDISSRTHLFRNQLMDEFRVIENGALSAHKEIRDNAPKYTSADLCRDDALFKDILLEKPHALIQFKIFKKINDNQQTDNQNVDKRLIRVKNMNTLPIGVWAHWLTDNKLFNNFILILILLNAIILGLQLELDPKVHWETLMILSLVDQISVLIFGFEILLRWMDNFWDFWTDGWNVFDFVVTTLSAIPEILMIMIGGGGPSADTISRVAQQMRLFRTLRSLKVIARFRSLRVIVRTIFEAFHSMATILFLLLLFMYIFGTFAINVFEKYTLSERDDLLYQYKFTNIHSAFIALFQLLTLDQWYLIELDIRQVIEYYITIPFFTLWVWFGAFIFQNIFVGVMVRNFQNISSQLSKKDEEKRVLAKNARTLRHLQQELRAPRNVALNNYQPLENGSPVDEPGRQGSDPNNTDNITGDYLEASQWQEIVQRTLLSIKSRRSEALWPRDTLFTYLQTMEKLQENMKEYQELRYLAACSLYEIYDH